MGPAFLRMIDTIPWSSYQYRGLTQIGLLNDESQIDSSMVKRNVTATCFNIPYTVFGGAGCEVYNLHYTQPGTPRLHETTDPTGDIDCTLQPLVVQPSFTEEDKEGRIVNGMMYDSLFFYPIIRGAGYSSMYDHYTRWIFDQVCQKVELLQEQASGPLFAPKQREGDPETENADIYRQIGNFLVSRTTTGQLVKIQIGLAVKYGENQTKSDHIVEFILDAPTEISDLVEKNDPTKSLQVNRIEPISRDLPFGLFVTKVEELIVNQAEAYASRAEDALTQTNSERDALLNYRRQLGHKYLNHYGRLVYLLKLLKYLNVTNNKPFLGIFHSITKILGSRKITNAPIDMCWPTCNDFSVIRQLMTEIKAFRPVRVPGAPVATRVGPARRIDGQDPIERIEEEEKARLAARSGPAAAGVGPGGRRTKKRTRRHLMF